MGLIGKVATKAVIKVAKDVALWKTVEHMDKNHSVRGILKKGEMKYKLIIEKKTKMFGKKFFVFDADKNKKYVILKEGQTIKLLDTSEKELGKVTSDKDCFTKWPDYYMYLNGKKLGKIEQEKTVKVKLNLRFNNWKVEGNFLQYDFNVFDAADKNILKVHKAYDSDNYVIEYNLVTNEIMGILILMLVELKNS